MELANLRINPGGRLRPAEVIGRDVLIQRWWAILERQSILANAERRSGKTSVLNKMATESHAGFLVVRRSLQALKSPDEFARQVLEDTRTALPSLFRRRFLEKLDELGIRPRKAGPLEFEPPNEKSWKDVLLTVAARVDREHDGIVAYFWDELPHMIQRIAADSGAQHAREVLDTLRHVREEHPRIRMLLTGSIGLHHTVAGLRNTEGAWAPVNDMATLSMPPLDDVDAVFLAASLLHTEGIQCDDVLDAASAIATEACAVPFYVHNLARALQDRQRKDGSVVTRSTVASATSAILLAPDDPLQIGHYVERLASYYGDDAALAGAILDVVALQGTPVPFRHLDKLLPAHVGASPAADDVRRLVDLLALDHYLTAVAPTGEIRFQLEIVRRGWIARRRLAT